MRVINFHFTAGEYIEGVIQMLFYLFPPQISRSKIRFLAQNFIKKVSATLCSHISLQVILKHWTRQKEGTGDESD